MSHIRIQFPIWSINYLFICFFLPIFSFLLYIWVCLPLLPLRDQPMTLCHSKWQPIQDFHLRGLVAPVLAHLTLKQQFPVQIQPSPRQTLSVLGQVASWNGTVHLRWLLQQEILKTGRKCAGLLVEAHPDIYESCARHHRPLTQSHLQKSRHCRTFAGNFHEQTQDTYCRPEKSPT